MAEYATWTTKNVVQKSRVEKFLQQNQPKIQPFFLDLFLIAFLGVSR
jgi:hypothetical protein